MPITATSGTKTTRTQYAHARPTSVGDWPVASITKTTNTKTTSTKTSNTKTTNTKWESPPNWNAGDSTVTSSTKTTNTKTTNTKTTNTKTTSTKWARSPNCCAGDSTTNNPPTQTSTTTNKQITTVSGNQVTQEKINNKHRTVNIILLIIIIVILLPAIGIYSYNKCKRDNSPIEPQNNHPAYNNPVYDTNLAAMRADCAKPPPVYNNNYTNNYTPDSSV